MSLIHKALKKAQSGSEEQAPNQPPVEEFAGEKPNWKSQFTPRTIALLALAILSLIFMIYKKISVKKFTPPQPVAAVSPQAAHIVSAPLSSTEADAVIEEGKKLYDGGKYDDALSKFLAASIQNPDNAVVYNNIGLIYKKKNDFGQAENYYKKALAIKQDYPECLNNMGVLKASSGDTLEAALYLKKAIAADSTYADAYFNLAVLNDGEGNYREAIANYKFFLQYTESNDNAFVGRIKARVEQLSE